MRKVLIWFFLAGFLFSTQPALFAADKGLNLTGSRNSAYKTTQQTQKEIKRAKRLADKKAKIAKKEAEKKKRKAEKEAQKKKKEAQRNSTKNKKW